MTSKELVSMAQGIGVSPAAHDRVIDLYAAEIAAADEAVAQLIAGLEARGLADPALFVVLSDHGKEFGDHGRYFHGITLQAESISIPLIFHDSRNPTTGKRIDEPVSIIDVAPSLLAAAGVEIPIAMHGRRIPTRPDQASMKLARRDLIAELHPDPIFEEHAIQRTQRASIVRWPWKWISMIDQDGIFYALDSDPTEESPIAISSTKISQELRSMVEEWQRRLDSIKAADPPPARAEDLSKERRDRLRALGYAD